MYEDDPGDGPRRRPILAVVKWTVFVVIVVLLVVTAFDGLVIDLLGIPRPG